MVFVYPAFLWALTAILVPLIIHLFNFRRYKKVYFTNVKFLKALQQESKSRSRLRELLILLCRMLAIACLVLAFCQPVIPGETKTTLKPGAKAISLYIDNSFSMENVGKQGPLLEVAKTRAKELVKVFGNADKFQVITNDFEGRHQRLHGSEDALNVIDEIRISPAVRRLSEVVKRQREFLNNSGQRNKQVYLFSDAQKSTFNIEDLTEDTLIRTAIITTSPNQVNNIFIDSCWFETPLQQKGFIQTLHASIQNKGNSRIDAGSAKLQLNGRQVAISSFSIDAGGKSEARFTFECKKEGFNFGSVKIEDYPVTFDDELYFAFNSRVSIHVNLVNAKEPGLGSSLTSLFGSDSLFELRSFNDQMIDYSAFKSADVIVLNQLPELSSGLVSELTKFTLKGGSLVIIPALKADPDSYNKALAALGMPGLGAYDSLSVKTDRIEMGTGFYAGVFEKMDDRLNLPVINGHYKLVRSNRSDFEGLLTLQNRDELLISARINNARVFLFACPLNERTGNFNKHALFVPTFYRLSFAGLKSAPLFYGVSDNVMIQLKNDPNAGEQPPHLKKTGSDGDIIPELRVVNNGLYLYTQRQVNSPGFYTVYRNADTLLPLAFNYSRMESDLVSFSNDELRKMIADKGLTSVTVIDDTGPGISKQVLEGADGKKLWKIFILLALLFISIEVALLRLLK